MASPFSLISALAFDPDKPRNEALLLLEYHRDRLVNAAVFFGWSQNVLDLIQGSNGLANIERAIREAVTRDSVGPYKARLVLTKSPPNLSCTLSTISKRPYNVLTAAFEEDSSVPILSVRIDTAATAYTPSSAHKTTDRGIYDAARSRCCHPPYDEVLMHNMDGKISEGSIRNVYFHRDGGWCTPPLSSGALDGVIRRYLINNGIVTERDMILKDVQIGEHILLSNGVEGCLRGRIAA